VVSGAPLERKRAAVLLGSKSVTTAPVVWPCEQPQSAAAMHSTARNAEPADLEWDMAATRTPIREDSTARSPTLPAWA
jgi:hypothetical protein